MNEKARSRFGGIAEVIENEAGMNDHEGTRLRIMRPNLKQLAGRGFDLRQLRAFIATIEFGGVSAAAKNIHVAQSTVSEALASLEQALAAKTR